MRSLLLSLLMLLPLVAGAVAAGVAGWEPERAWSADPAGAPTDETIEPADLLKAMQALNEASAQAGFLSSGTTQLTQGTGELKSGADELGGGVDQLAGGSQQLYDGLVQLQSGTAQLGSGATELADGVGSAVDQVIGLGVVQGQLLAAIDGTLKDLEGNNSAEARNIRSQLGDLRTQVNNFELDQSITDKLKRAKDGSRELSNQLAVSGYAYHDGIYSAVEGAKQLNAGLGELNANVDKALEGVDQLDSGAQKIDGMARQNKSKVQAVSKALPRVSQESEPEPLLSPIVAMLLAAVVVLGGGLLGAVLPRASKPWLTLVGGVLGLTAVGAVLFAVLATVPAAPSIALAAGVAALGAAASAGLVFVVMRVAGAAGAVLSAVLGVVQVALVGWLWKSAVAGTAVPVVATVAGYLFPMQWATSGFTAAGNGAHTALLWTAVAVLGAVAVLCLGAARGLREAPAEAKKQVSDNES